MTDLNNVTLIGRLVANPEVRYSATGTPVLRVSIAVNESIKKITTGKITLISLT